MYYELYIDVLFLENFMMDSLLLLVINRILQWGHDLKRILFGGVVGSALTCVTIIVSIPVWIKCALFYVVIPILMLGITEREYSMERLLEGLLLLYLLAVFLGGILTVFRPYLRYISLFYGLSLISTQGILAAWRFLRIIKINQERFCEVILYTELDCYKINALKDTGNCLTDPLSGEGVHVLDCNFYEQVIREETQKRTDTGEPKEDIQTTFRYIPYRSVGGSSIMKVFRIKKMCVGREKKQWIEFPLIGVSESPVCGDGSYQLILNCKALQELN